MEINGFIRPTSLLYKEASHLVTSMCTNRYGFMRTQLMVIQTCTFIMILSYRLFPSAQHGLIAQLKVEKKVQTCVQFLLKEFV